MSAGEDERRWLEGLDERTEYEREYEHRMSAGDRDTLASVITSHEFWEASELLKSMCRGHSPVVTFDGKPFEPEAWREYAAHLADVLLASDWLREQRSEAWLKGHLKGMHYTHPEICDDEICPNPYRTTEDTDAH